jgi:outer membrane receptor protein involved in Fe transport
VDDCTSDVSLLTAAGSNPLKLDPYNRTDPAITDLDTYAEAILATNPSLTAADLVAFAPCNYAKGGDGISDAPAGFAQNSKTDTEQFSQEIRGSWAVNDRVNLSSGLLYWKERVEQDSLNSTTISGGPACFIQNTDVDAAFTGLFLNGGTENFTSTNPVQDQCGNTFLPVAHWMDETYQGRKDGGGDVTKRDTDHYSWYGSVDYDLTDKLTTRLEARFTREDNEVTGNLQNPCYDPNARVGDDDCTDAAGGDRTEVGGGGRPLGPSSAVLCGSTGRCDTMGVAASSNSLYYDGAKLADGAPTWWGWGYGNMWGDQASVDKTDRFWAPKATLEYAWTDDVMTYFSWSRGIKPGGFSLLSTGAFGLDANLDGNYDEIDYDSERLDVWELGAKTTLFDGRVRLNGSAYYQDFKDKQVTVQAVVGDTVGTVVRNIQGSEVYGFEFDGTWQITEQLRVSGGYTYLDTEYTDYDIITQSTGDISRLALGEANSTCDEIKQIPGTTGDSNSDYGCALSFNGNELERAPKHAFQATLNWSDTLLDTGYDWYTETSFRYQDSRYVEAFNVAEFAAYNITDWRIGIIADTWEVTGFVDNVFDDDTITTGGSNVGLVTGSFGIGVGTTTGLFPPGVNAGPKLPSDVYAQLPNPRIAGVRATFRFGE